MFHLTPIELLIEQMGAASFIRTRAHLQPFTDTPNGHLKIWARVVDCLNLQEETDIIENTTTLNCPYNVNIVSLTNDTKNISDIQNIQLIRMAAKLKGKQELGLSFISTMRSSIGKVTHCRARLASSKLNLKQLDRPPHSLTVTNIIIQQNTSSYL